jgi:hypothetical protein
MEFTKKQNIDKAMNVVWFSISPEYSLYIYVLSPEEKATEIQDVADAWKILNDYGIGIDAVMKHADRMNNSYPIPVRFIDRHFAKCESDDLPF